MRKAIYEKWIEVREKTLTVHEYDEDGNLIGQHEEPITRIVYDYDDDGEVIGQHREPVTEEVEVSGLVYRDMTEDEIEEVASTPPIAPAATNEELEEAVLELAQNQSDIEDAILELAELIGG